MELQPETWAAIIGAVVGSVTGGLISIVIQLFVIRAARNERHAEKRDLQIKIAKLVIVKVRFIYLNLYEMHFAIEKEFTRSDKGNHPCLFLSSISNLPEPVLLKDQEQSLLLDLETPHVLDLVRLHNSVIVLLKQYNSMRVELESLLPRASKVEGSKSVHMVEIDTDLELMRKIHSLDDFIGNFRSQLKENYRESELGMVELTKSVKEKLEFEVVFEEDKIRKSSLNELIKINYPRGETE